MRKIQEFTNGAQVAKVYKNAETGEFIARFFNDGRYLEAADYFTNDKADALATAQSEIARNWGEVAPLGEEVGGYPVPLLRDIVETAPDCAEWATVRTLGRDKATGTPTAVQFTDCEDSSVCEVLTLEKVAQALDKIKADPALLRDDLSRAILADIAARAYESMDAEAADAIAQIALFGDVVYC